MTDSHNFISHYCLVLSIRVSFDDFRIWVTSTVSSITQLSLLDYAVQRGECRQNAGGFSAVVQINDRVVVALSWSGNIFAYQIRSNHRMGLHFLGNLNWHRENLYCGVAGRDFLVAGGSDKMISLWPLEFFNIRM